MVSKQDRGRVRNAQEFEQKYNFAGMQKAQKLNEAVINKVNKELENFVSAVVKNGSVETYYHSGTPTMTSYPVNTWTEVEIGRAHV